MLLGVAGFRVIPPSSRERCILAIPGRIII